MLDCIKDAYKELLKDGLTPIAFNFPSMEIETKDFNKVGLSFLEDRVALAIENDSEYSYYLHKDLKNNKNFEINYDNLKEMDKTIRAGYANNSEISEIGKMIVSTLPKLIKADANINVQQFSKEILNKICADQINDSLLELTLFKTLPIDDTQDKLIATLILLKSQIPTAYRVIKSSISHFKDLPDEIEINGKIIDCRDNKFTKGVIAEIEKQEINPDANVVRYIHKYEPKFAMENYPVQMKALFKEEPNLVERKAKKLVYN